MCSLKPELHDAAWCSCCSKMRIVSACSWFLGCRSAVWRSLICGLPHIAKRSETLEMCVDVIFYVCIMAEPRCFASIQHVWYSPHVQWKGWYVAKRAWLVRRLDF